LSEPPQSNLPIARLLYCAIMVPELQDTRMAPSSAASSSLARHTGYDLRVEFNWSGNPTQSRVRQGSHRGTMRWYAAVLPLTKFRRANVAR
jgi:hypothetical protein